MKLSSEKTEILLDAYRLTPMDLTSAGLLELVNHSPSAQLTLAPRMLSPTRYVANGVTNPPSVQIEFVIDNGSKWKQIVPTELTNSYQKIALQLNENDFSLSEGTGDFDLSMTSQVTLLLTAHANDSGGARRIMYLDDIVLFNNPRTLTLSQTSVFKPSDGASQVTITALVEDDDVPAEGVDINFMISAGNGSLDCTGPPVTTDTNGEAECTYTVGDFADIVEIVVEEN